MSGVWGVVVDALGLNRWLGGVIVILACCVWSSMVGQAWALSEARKYEMVSPPFKGGYSAQEIDGISMDGNKVAYFSLGAFAKTPGGPTFTDYMAQRKASGWSTVALLPPANVSASIVATDLSPSLETIMVQGVPGTTYGWSIDESLENEFLLHETSLPDTEALWVLVGGIHLKTISEERFIQVAYVGASQDFCHILFVSSYPFTPDAVGTKEQQLYDLSQGCKGTEPSIQLMGIKNDQPEGELIDAACAVELGAGTSRDYASGKGSAYDAVADEGHEVLFTAGVEEAPNSCVAHHQLFARLGETRTIEVSRAPEAGKPVGGCERASVAGEVPCLGSAERPSANFVGASENGGIVFYTSPESLASESPKDLYATKLGCPDETECAPAEREVLSVDLVSNSINSGEAAGVQGVARVAPNGGRVYYVATGVLSNQRDSEGQLPVKGADNLYVYNVNTGDTNFVTDLCSGPGDISGAVREAQCPEDLNEYEGTSSGAVNDRPLWRNTAESEVQTGDADGQFLVFSSYGRLTVDDTGSAKNVYRYDAATGDLQRVSVGEGGADDNGDSSEANATIAFGPPGSSVIEQQGMSSRAISEDGSRVVFSTSESLSEKASNGLVNIYEWRQESGSSEARVSMISCGCATEPDKQVVISPSGQDVFFTTAAGLVGRDTDGAVDIYDAHECTASVPCSMTTAGEAEQCESEGCYGPLTNPEPLLVPGSVAQAPGGNVASPGAHPGRKPTIRACPKGKKRQSGRCVRAKRKVKPKRKAKKSNSRRKAGR